VTPNELIEPNGRRVFTFVVSEVRRCLLRSRGSVPMVEKQNPGLKKPNPSLERMAARGTVLPKTLLAQTLGQWRDWLAKHHLPTLFALVTLLIIGVVNNACSGAKAEATASQIAFHKLQQDLEVAALLRRLKAEAAHAPLVIQNVHVVNPEAETVTPGQTVIVLGSRINWVGDSAKAPIPPSALIIDGTGGFLSPGLVDMHVHSSSAAGWLLNLNNGVTTLRDMDGFPWLLRLRNAVYAKRMLAPIDYVAGTIINAAPLDGYALVARNSADARRMVRQQAACGYDFIKIHNNCPTPMFDAIAEQAHALGMDLVGHIPHDISIDHALHRGGMRTTEHLKGFLIDQTLLPSKEDSARL
jgi:hypothetical protein